jgi:DNA (cytosine-5)-methyltransferase 1
MNYRWTKAEYPKERKHNVFSTFACGGGSSMGYKLAGYNVIGANDIDPKMAKIYQENHKPKLYYLEDIRALTERTDLDPALFTLDILDGSPPCTTFSMAGKREESWGKERKYVEGNVSQTLDDLYFRFLELADKLKPKIIVSENVSGLAKGNAKVYLNNILKKFREIGYEPQIFLLNGASMGVPQRRERIFVIGRRTDLNLPPLKLEFHEKPIKYGEYRSPDGKEPTDHMKKVLLNYQRGDKCVADIVERVNGKLSGFTCFIVDDEVVYPTVTSGGENYRSYDRKKASDMDLILSSSFPTDYDFMGIDVKYVVGMSVPPLMVYGVSKAIKEQWLDKLEV